MNSIASASNALLKDVFYQSKVEKVEVGYSTNNILITSGDLYPLHVVIKNLGLSKLPISESVLSVGEGASPFISEINRQGGNARGLDVWYAEENLPHDLRQFVEENHKSLNVGTATNLPFPNSSFDMVVSHMLLNNLDLQTSKKAIVEMLRVARNEVRVAGHSGRTGQEIVDYVKKVYGDKIEVSISQFSTDWTLMSSPVYLDNYHRHMTNELIIFKIRN